MTSESFWRGRRILVTGHTGFKGSWLCSWLLKLGAEVHGIALPPDTTPSLFKKVNLEKRMSSSLLDIRNAEALAARVRETDPEIVFHLAAQPLVRASYADPLRTWSTNVMGTANLLHAIVLTGRPCTVVAVTTDKVYRNEEWVHPYRETDALGGHDPYAASKAAMEVLVDSWRKSFLADGTIRLASARAGNVIGGGDWATDRIIPDFVRARLGGEPVHVRNADATRPWQHVLEPLHGYMALARHMVEHDGAGAEAWNFGPDSSAERSVGDLISECSAIWPGQVRQSHDPSDPHEASRLTLSTAKARALLCWSPAWDFERTIRETVTWYRDEASGADPAILCAEQIERYEACR